MARPKSTRKCLVENCGKDHYGENLCRMHFTRMKRNGIVESKYDKTGYVPLGGVQDNTPGRRGSLAVNIINDIKYKAIKRGKEWKLTHQEAFDLITKPCDYWAVTYDHLPNSLRPHDSRYSRMCSRRIYISR